MKHDGVISTARVHARFPKRDFHRHVTPREEKGRGKKGVGMKINYDAGSSFPADLAVLQIRFTFDNPPMNRLSLSHFLPLSLSLSPSPSLSCSLSPILTQRKPI